MVLQQAYRHGTGICNQHIFARSPCHDNVIRLQAEKHNVVDGVVLFREVSGKLIPEVGGPSALQWFVHRCVGEIFPMIAKVSFSIWAEVCSAAVIL